MKNGEIEIVAEGGIVVVDNVVLNAWHTAYTLGAVEALERALTRAAQAHPGKLCALGIYRFRRLRPSDLPDAATRLLLQKVANAHSYRCVVTVLDTPGLFTTTVRLFAAGLVSMSKMPNAVAESIDEGVGLLGAAGCNVAVVEPALKKLVDRVFPASPVG